MVKENTVRNSKNNLWILILLLTACVLQVGIITTSVFAEAGGDYNYCGDNLTWTSDNVTLRISRAGNMKDYNFRATAKIGPAPWGFDPPISEIIVEPGVTGIGSYGFYRCSNVTRVELPVTLTYIGNDAFHNCMALTDVYFGGSREEWDALVAAIAPGNDELLNARLHVNEESDLSAPEDGDSANEKDDYSIYEVPVISTESPMDLLTLVGYEDKYYVSVEDLAELARCSVSYPTDSNSDLPSVNGQHPDEVQASESGGKPAFAVLRRGTAKYTVSAQSNANIPCIFYNESIYCELVPSIQYLEGACVIIEEFPYLLVTMPRSTFHECILPNMESYNYDVSGGGSDARVILEILMSWMDPSSGHFIIGSSKEYIRDALKAILDIDYIKYSSVQNQYVKDASKTVDALNKPEQPPGLLDGANTLYEASNNVIGIMLDAQYGRLYTGYKSSRAKAEMKDFDGWYEEIHKVEDEYLDVYKPAHEINTQADLFGALLDSMVIALNVASSTVQMVSYEEDERNLYNNALSSTLLKTIQMENDIYWRDEALSLSDEINADIGDIARTEFAKEISDYFIDKGLDSAAEIAGYMTSFNGLAVGKEIAGLVVGTLFKDEFAASASGLNAAYINEFQQNTLVMLKKLPDTFTDDYLTIQQQEQLKALLSLYYREIIAFSENASFSMEELDLMPDKKTLKQLADDADKAALYLYRLMQWNPVAMYPYSRYKDRLLTDEWLKPYCKDTGLTDEWPDSDHEDTNPTDDRAESDGYEVENNGGEVVRLRNKTYYWRYHAGSVEETGMIGYSAFIDGEPNELIERNDNGTEKVILTAPGNGPLYIVKDRIYYREKYGKWNSVTVEGGSPETTGEGIELIAADTVSGTIIYDDIYAEKVFCREEAGGRSDLFVKNDENTNSFGNVLTLKDGVLYYYNYNRSDRSLTAYSYNLSSKTPNMLGSTTVNMDFMEGLVFTGQIWEDDLYVSCVTQTGTGAVYNNGCIFAFSLEGNNCRQLVDDNDEHPQVYKDFYFTEENGTSYLYYYGGDWLSGYGFEMNPCFTEGVMRLNLDTTQVESVDVPWIKYGTFGYLNGEIVTRGEETTPDLLTVCSAQTLSDMGCPVLNNWDSERCCCVRSFNLVGDTAWIELSESVKDDSASRGWRQGYRRLGTSVYRTKIGTERPVLVYSY